MKRLLCAAALSLLVGISGCTAPGAGQAPDQARGTAGGVRVLTEYATLAQFYGMLHEATGWPVPEQVLHEQDGPVTYAQALLILATLPQGKAALEQAGAKQAISEYGNALITPGAASGLIAWALAGCKGPVPAP